MGVWSEHGTSWYNCNRFEEKSGSDARDAQAVSRKSLERYLHYYNRFANHEQSAKLDKDIYLKTEKKMQQLQNSTGKSLFRLGLDRFAEFLWTLLTIALCLEDR
jgi:ariadne-1